MGQLARLKENLAIFKSSHPASSMAQSFAYCNPCQNPPFDSKDKLAGGTPTESNDRRTLALVTIRIPIPAVALVIAPLIAFGSLS